MDAASRLLALARQLQRAGAPRSAALALDAAAACTRPALAPAARAGALLAGARLLARTGRVEDAVRARGMLRRAEVILDGGVGMVEARLEVAVLLEAVCEGEERGRVVKEGLRVVRGREGEIGAAWDWWVYFKAREVAGARGEGARVARAAAEECRRAGDVVAAVGFELMAVQAWLGGGGTEGEVALERARRGLEGAGEGRDAATLRVCCGVLGGLGRLKVGDVVGAREEGQVLVAAFDKARIASGKGAEAAQWKWVHGKVMRALVQHVLAGGTRGAGDGEVCWKYASGALSWAGLGDGSAGWVADKAVLFGAKLEPHAETALAVVLLESAARVRLERVELEAAGALIRVGHEMIRGGGPGLALSTQAAVYLLAAEWYMLQGTFVGAERATQYLSQIVASADAGGAGRRELGDVAELARTHHSLLTGEKRLGGVGGGDVAQEGSAASKGYVNGAVRAAALFAEGVHEMRQASVLEAKAALLAARAVVCAGGAAVSDQLSSNVCTTLASLYLSHQNIAEGTGDVLATAIGVAEAGGDLVTRARTLRMQRKLITRSGAIDPGVLAEVDAKRTENDRLLAIRQNCAERL